MVVCKFVEGPYTVFDNVSTFCIPPLLELGHSFFLVILIANMIKFRGTVCVVGYFNCLSPDPVLNVKRAPSRSGSKTELVLHLS